MQCQKYRNMKLKVKKGIYVASLSCIIIGVFLCLMHIFFWGTARHNTYIYVPTGASYHQVLDSIGQNHIFRKDFLFKQEAKIFHYKNRLKAGRYEVKQGMRADQLLRNLIRGKQKPLNLTFNNIRTLEQFSARIGQQIEADSSQLIQLFNDEAFLKTYTLTPETVKSIFIPNTYEFFWNTSAENFFKRMYVEYEKFWHTGRLSELQKTGLTQLQAIIIASIVAEETRKNDEKPLIASVYMNRMKKNMRLQADPTVKYAVGDFSLKRITGIHLKTVSPYNTYLRNGLPPGPICMPDISSIDAVLANKQTPYLYFCAKEDFSGYHRFAVTFAEHQKNARKYQQALNKRNIK